ncbi:MAG TPA: hypothetical protein VFS00_07220 [Polyangiaceae bacterium]|nr:hypothetical protein [Polyangiaceae bacterium]
MYHHQGSGARAPGRPTPHAPTDCNPSWDHAERQARDWAARGGLVTTDRDRRRLAKMGQGRMAGWLAPHADPGELALLAQWGAFIALVDDTYDRDAQAGPAQVDDLMGRLVAGVARPSADHDTSIPAVRALVDLWSRSVVGTARGWAPRFAEHYRRFADATREEARLRAGGVRLDLKRNLELRRHTITAMPVLDLIERALPAEADALDELRWLAVDAIAWTNDLASADRELAEGADNLVGVLARERRCDRHEAAAIARAMLDERMHDFDAAAAALTAAGPWQAELGPRVALLRAAAAALALPLSRGTAGRGQLKFAMLRAVLHLLCGAPAGDLEIPPLAAADEITTFTEVHRLALRIVQAPHPDAVPPGERERLLDLLGTSRNRVLWEASATIHLLGLHAVRRFRPTHRVLADGLLRLTLA